MPRMLYRLHGLLGHGIRNHQHININSHNIQDNNKPVQFEHPNKINFLNK